VLPVAFGVIVLGVLLGLGGAAVMARGAPYYMLEWGVAYLAAGAIALSTGLILVVLGLVLRRVAAVERQIDALSRAPEIPVAPPVSPSISPALAGGAGAALAAGSVLAADLSASRTDDRERLADATEAVYSAEPAHSLEHRPAAEPVPEDRQETPASTLQAEPVSASETEVARAASDPVETNLAGSARDILSAVAMPRLQVEPPAVPPALADADADPFARINKALLEIRKGALGDEASTSEPSPGQPPPGEPSPGEPSPSQQSPREQDRPDELDRRPATLDADPVPPPLLAGSAAEPADLNDLRSALLDEDANEPVHGWDAVADFRPVAGAEAALSLPDAVAEPEHAAQAPASEPDELTIPPIIEGDDRVDIADPMPAQRAADAPARPDAHAPDLEQPDLEQPGDLPGQAMKQASEQASGQASEQDRSGPAVSDDGVIAAYTVGDSAFTMYADGRIVAETPEGRYSFASMDELRLFMAERRQS
jgi:hypothetical protein